MPILEHSRGKYFPFEELVWMPSGKRDEPQARVLLQRNSELLRKVATELEENGERRFTYVGSGSASLVLRTADGIFTRISTHDPAPVPTLAHPNENAWIEMPRTQSEIVLQALPGKTRAVTVSHPTGTSSVVLEQVPEISTTGVTDEHIRAIALRATELNLVEKWLAVYITRDEIDGRNANRILDHIRQSYPLNPTSGGDIQRHNIGLLKDGTPLVFDADTLVPFREKDISMGLPQMVADWLEPRRATTSHFEWTLPGGVWKQYAEFPELVSGEFKEGVTEKQLQELSALEGNKAVVNTIRWDNRYRGEMSAMLMDAAANGGNDTQEGFEKRIQEARGERPPGRSPENNSKRLRVDPDEKYPRTR